MSGKRQQEFRLGAGRRVRGETPHWTQRRAWSKNGAGPGSVKVLVAPQTPTISLGYSHVVQKT